VIGKAVQGFLPRHDIVGKRAVFGNAEGFALRTALGIAPAAMITMPAE
jgi:hypothetical protein